MAVLLRFYCRNDLGILQKAILNAHKNCEQSETGSIRYKVSNTKNLILTNTINVRITKI